MRHPGRLRNHPHASPPASLQDVGGLPSHVLRLDGEQKAKRSDLRRQPSPSFPPHTGKEGRLFRASHGRGPADWLSAKRLEHVAFEKR